MRKSDLELAREAAIEAKGFDKSRAYAKLYLRKKGQIEKDAQSICARLSRMGRCDETLCPSGCEFAFLTALEVVTREFNDAIIASPDHRGTSFSWKVRDDDVRREWNKSRGLNQELQTNTFQRSGKLTEYGKLFASEIAKSELNGLSISTAVSWLKDLYDDACDNSRIEWRQSSEFEGSPIYLDVDRGTKFKYGFNVKRIHDLRSKDAKRQKLDKSVQAKYRPGNIASSTSTSELEQALTRTVMVCKILLDCVQKVDASLRKIVTQRTAEYFVAIPIPQHLDTSSVLIRTQIETSLLLRDIDFRWETSDEEWILMVSHDDVVRLDGLNDPLREIERDSHALFDDFERAWRITRGVVKDETKSIDILRN